MQKKHKRILWLLNHTILREFEVPLLISLGFEVYIPKLFPIDETNLSASVSYDYDNTLSIPQAALNVLNTHDFYSDFVTAEIRQLLNQYFGTAIFAFFPHLFQQLVYHFRGNLLVQAFGLSGTLTYTNIITQAFEKNFWQALNTVEKRLWFKQPYKHIANIEGDLLKKRALTLPLGMPNTYFQHQNSWSGTSNTLLFVCPRIKSSPHYYGKIYAAFKKHFGDLPHIIAGAQPITVDDPTVKGFQPREQLDQWLTDCKVMFYHSEEPRHLHYHPVEAILFGMPLVYMRSGMLGILGGSDQPGACATFQEARIKIEKILSDDQPLIQKILQHQTKILGQFEPEAIKNIWQKNFLAKVIIPSVKTTQKKLTLGVFLPIGYRGGSLRGAKNIAKMLKLGSQADGNSVNVIFSYVADTYDVTNEFADLVAMGITIRETRWQVVSGHEISIANRFKEIPLQDEKNTYLVPTDGVCNFNDCDFWLLISDRTSPAIAPLKPYGVMVYDYIQRYLPGITVLDYKQYLATETERIKTVRNAQFVLVTTPQTREDAIQYAGLNANNVILMPLEVNLFNVSTQTTQNNAYFIWVTNTSSHKNHLRALEALEIYYQEHDGTLEVAVTGYNTLAFDKTNILKNTKNPYLDQVRCHIEKSPLLKQKLHFLGDLSESRYCQTISQAKFLWHPTLIDNGTFSVIEAAYYQVPSLSSDYPQMRYMDEQFRLNLLFFNALSNKDMAEKLAFMEKNVESQKALLPDKSHLEKFTYQQLALPFWQLIKERL